MCVCVYIYIFSMSFIAFLFVLFMTLRYANAHPLFWWLYNDDTAYHILGLLQKVSNLSEIKFLHIF